jgi:excisionase family DNA binding protein
MVPAFDSRPYWKPRDVAALLELSPSQVYRMIESGELEHRRIGARAIRIPAHAVAALLGVEAPTVAPVVESHDERVDLRARTEHFIERTGRTPERFASAWREGRIDDTPDNARDAIEALALREARAGLTVPA